MAGRTTPRRCVVIRHWWHQLPRDCRSTARRIAHLRPGRAGQCPAAQRCQPALVAPTGGPLRRTPALCRPCRRPRTHRVKCPATGHAFSSGGAVARRNRPGASGFRPRRQRCLAVSRTGKPGHAGMAMQRTRQSVGRNGQKPLRSVEGLQRKSGPQLCSLCRAPATLVAVGHVRRPCRTDRPHGLRAAGHRRL